jgi:hypothetical protein
MWASTATTDIGSTTLRRRDTRPGQSRISIGRDARPGWDAIAPADDREPTWPRIAFEVSAPKLALGPLMDAGDVTSELNVNLAARQAQIATACAPGLVDLNATMEGNDKAV